jgi:predicted Fe-Mo cluster-binding NifX family protein
MKIAITAQGPGAGAPVDQRFGRAACFVLVDTTSGETRSLDNDAGQRAAQGAGIQAVEAIAGLGAECLITGDVGPKAFFALEAAGITTYVGAHGTVSDAIEAFEHRELRRASGPGHRGHRW